MKHPCKTWNGEPAKYAQLKLDGNYTRISVDQFGKPFVHTSIGTDITQQCIGYTWFRPFIDRVSPGTAVLGELYVPRKPCSVVKTALVEQWNDLSFGAFAVESLAAATPLEEVERFCVALGLEYLPYRLIKEGDTVEKLMADLPMGAEGYVLKNGNLLDWYKLKPVKTIDLIVKGYEEGYGKYSGFVGSIICETCEGYEVAKVSGMDDATRKSLDCTDVGRVLEVKYQTVGTRGRLRHPRFVGWRDDKQAGECFIDQDPDLEAYWT